MKKPIVLFIELKIASKNKYVCEITEKLFDNNISVTIYASTSNTVELLNNLLWTWKQDSFIPHAILNTNLTPSDSPSQTLLTSSRENLPETEALILYDPLPLDDLNRFKMIIDFAEVYHSEKKIESRERYKEMRDLDTFDLHFTQLGTVLSKKSISI